MIPLELQADSKLSEEHLYIPLPCMHFYKPQLASCHAPVSTHLFHSGGARKGRGGLSAALFSDPSKRLLLSKCEKSFSTCALLLFPASSSHPPPQLLFAGFPPSPPVSSHSVFLLFVSDSETTEDETTEPQMETKEGPGRHHDKAGRKGPSGILFKLLFSFF